MKYYCIGIKGTGMSTLAQILSDLGNTVSGYDDAKGHKFTQDGLEERNIPIYYDRPDCCVTGCSFVIVSLFPVFRIKHNKQRQSQCQGFRGKEVQISGKHTREQEQSIQWPFWLSYNYYKSRYRK